LDGRSPENIPKESSPAPVVIKAYEWRAVGTMASWASQALWHSRGFYMRCCRSACMASRPQATA
jgi:hypothetical protein